LRQYKVEFKTSAQKELKKLPKVIQIKIIDAMKLLMADPYSFLLPLRKMEGRSHDNRFRLRVGKYRVIYEIHERRVIIFVIRIGHRKDVYR